MIIIANVTDRTGNVSAMKATHWTPMKKMIFEAAAAKEGMIITYSTR